MSAPASPLSINGIYVSLDGMPILRDVSLSVAAGEVVALVGGNGSGKSTLLRAALGLVAHQAGTVSLFGQTVPGFSDWSKVGYVPQHSTVSVANATVREIASSGRLSHRKPFQWLSRQDRIERDHALDLVGMAERSRWPFSALSGGQKQRVLIARALASEPQLLVMDEPLAGVDLHSQEGLASLLTTLSGEGLALLVVLHELGPMASLLDRTVRLCDGRVVSSEHPPPEDTTRKRADSPRGFDDDPISGVAS